jgi:hypothetical protein
LGAGATGFFSVSGGDAGGVDCAVLSSAVDGAGFGSAGGAVDAAWDLFGGSRTCKTGLSSAQTLFTLSKTTQTLLNMLVFKTDISFSFKVASKVASYYVLSINEKRGTCPVFLPILR